MKYFHLLILSLVSELGSAQSANEINWLNRNIVTLNGFNSNSPYEDLKNIEIFQRSDVIGLGEATHGTREIFKMKHRLIEFLAKEKGFSIVAIESDFSSSSRINDFIISGKGDSSLVMKSLSYSLLRTEEIWEMIVWAKNYNNYSNKKIRFIGIDMQSPHSAIDNLYAFANENNRPDLQDLLAKLRDKYKESEASSYSGSGTKKEVLEISKSVSHLIQLSTASSFLKQTATTLLQLAEMNNKIGPYKANSFRDRAMFENLEWIIKENRDSKIILWAHNGHVEKKGGLSKTLGYHLGNKLGNGYVSVGFAVGRGTYSAHRQDSKGWSLEKENDLLEPISNSFESWFVRAKDPIFYLDLKNHIKGLDNVWLLTKRSFRSIGWAIPEKKEYQFAPNQDIVKLFDAIIFIRNTTSSNYIMWK